MKRILLFIVIVLLLLVTLWFILQQQQSSTKEQISKTDYRMELVVDYVFDTSKEAEINKAKPFTLLGRGAAGRIANLKGEIIFEPQAGSGIYAMDPNPLGSLVYVYLGKKSFILNPKTNKSIDLPTKPECANMLSFGSWKWINDDLLIAESGTQELDASGKPMTCCEGHNVKATKLYTYRVSSQKLSEVNLPEFIAAKTFMINQVSSDGYVEIATDENQLFKGHKAGWFQISSPRK